MIFYRCQSADDTNGQLMVFKQIFFPERCALLRFVLGEPVKIEAQRDHLHFCGIADLMLSADLLFLNGADGHNSAALARKVTLNGFKNIGFKSTEIALKYMPVKSMHDHRHARMNGGQPADSPGFA